MKIDFGSQEPLEAGLGAARVRVPEPLKTRFGGKPLDTLATAVCVSYNRHFRVSSGFFLLDLSFQHFYAFPLMCLFLSASKPNSHPTESRKFGNRRKKTVKESFNSKCYPEFLTSNFFRKILERTKS